MPSDKALVQVTVTYYKKGDEIDAPEDDHALWLQCVEDTTEENPKLKEPQPEPAQANDGTIYERVDKPLAYVFTEDNVAFDFEFIGASDCPDYSCNLAIEIEQVGMYDVFAEFVEDFKKAADAMREPPKNPSREWWDVKKQTNVVRLIAIVRVGYWGGYEGDCDINIDLDGFVSLNGGDRLSRSGLTAFNLAKQPPPEADEDDKEDES
jgi:hypothetical protein